MANIRLTDQQLEHKDTLLELVERENIRQIAKHGLQERTPFEWMTFLAEEVGELAQAISNHAYRDDGALEIKAKYLAKDVVDEAIQTATLALKIAEMYLVEIYPGK